MSSTADATQNAAPDRVFARAAGIALAAALTVTVAAHGMLDRAMRTQGQAAELALVGADEAAAARAVAAGLGRIPTLAPGPEDQAARSRLAWDVDRLTALEERRRTLTSGASPAWPASSDLSRMAAAARELAQRRVADPDAALELQAKLQGQVLPQLDLIALRHRAEAARAVAHGRLALAGSIALHLAVGAVLAAAVLLPARRRIADWVTSRREAERETRFRLLHDPLTGMPNAAYLEAHLAQAAAADVRRSSQTAVLHVDLDRFKVLRQTLDERACDEVIRIAASRVRKTLRTGDFAAYVGQDDFVVVAAEIAQADVATIAGRIQSALEQPFSIRGGARRISASIGVTLVSDDEPAPERILGNARIALAAAQRAGPASVRCFGEKLRVEVEQREALFSELVGGLALGEIGPWFQPQIDLATGAFSGFEALVRWEHPRDGVLAPAAFLDFAEATDLTERIGETVLARSLRALRAWDAAGLEVPRIGVNFALAQLRDPRLIEKIKWEVERHDVDPSRLAIEVLETVLIKSDTDMVVRNLRGLASAGFHVELDDFGTGHASIANLRRFMVRRIKIDRSFIDGIEEREEQRKLTGSMIAMAHALGIATLAEGVESAEAAATLRRLGCDFAQGFALAAPMSEDEAGAWLRRLRDGEGLVPVASDPTPTGPNLP